MKAALVTGASSGIGQATARALAAAGFVVGLAARREDRIAELAASINDAGQQAIPLVTDVTVTESVNDAVAALAAVAPIEVAVCNAGAMWPDPVERLDASGFAAQLETNVIGAHRVAAAVIADMVSAGSGDIVFVTSLNATVPRPLVAAYNASKAALETYARTLQMELECTGVRASIVRPGPTLTEMGWSWPPEDINAILESWKHWGLQRHHHYLDPDAIASAVTSVVTAPPEVHFSLVEVLPVAPSDTQRNPA
jgi:NADP-dependent 3-hydroxy acid dehydrogenase YdfG